MRYFKYITFPLLLISLVSCDLVNQIDDQTQNGDSDQDGGDSNEISSNISSDRTLSADQEFVVSGDISVRNGATLTIEPGVHLRFKSGASLQIRSVIDAQGTADNPIRLTATSGNEQQGWWDGIGFYSSNQNNTLKHVQIQHAGKTDFGGISEAASVAMNDGSALTITQSTINDGSGYGFYIDGGDVTLTFSNNSFSGNKQAPMWIPFSHIGAVDTASRFPQDSHIRVWGKNATSKNITITPVHNDVPYRFSSNFDIGNNASVTIESGVEMEFESGIGITVSSVLTANGTSADPITMTATPGNEQQGWWQGIAFYSNNLNNKLNHVQIHHAGKTDFGGISEAASVALNDNSALTLTNSTIADGSGYGLYIDGDDVELDFSNNTFSGNKNASAWIPFRNIGAIDNASSFPTDSYVRVYGLDATDKDITIHPLQGDVPYRFSGTPDISNNASVAIEAGVEMTFESGTGITVSTVLTANGSSTDPITMTATPGNEQQGWWNGIAFYSNNLDNELNYVHIRHAGKTDYGGISEAANVAVNDNSQLTVNNSEITDSGNHGIYCDGSSSTLSLSSNFYQNNAGQDVVQCQ